MKKMFLINSVLALLVLIPLQAFSYDSCLESKKIWRGRIEFDIEMRRKRMPMRKTLAELRLQDNDLDGKMADIEEKILKAEDEIRMDDLWNEYESISKKRDLIHEKRGEVYKGFVKVCYERMSGKLEMKIADLEKRYECVVNDKLNGKLGQLQKDIAASGKFSKRDLEEFNELAEARKVVLKDLAMDYGKYEEEVGRLFSEIEEVKGLILANEEMSDKLDVRENQLYNDVYSKFDDLRKRLKEGSNELAARSEQLINYIEIME